MATVRDAVFDGLRGLGATTVFANPGSTEVAFLTGFPDDLHFVLGLHESSVVGMAAGHALASGTPSVVLLHTTAGFGNAAGALATARTNRAPMVVLVGQQDRRHLASEPFLAGHLRGLAGEYPVAFHEPARAADVPGTVVRAWHEATALRGPAVVTVPMGDWHETADDRPPAAPAVLRLARGADPDTGAELAARVDAARAPVLVTGPGADEPGAREAVAGLAGRLDCPVYQAAYAAQAGFDHRSPRFRGHLPAGRAALRKVLAPHDLVLVIGAPAFRQGAYEDGPFVARGTQVAVLTGHFDEAAASTADFAVVGDVAALCTDLAGRIAARKGTAAVPGTVRELVPPQDGMLRAEHVYATLAARLPESATVLEESPSTRGALLDLVPARGPFGFLTVAQGGLGFALPAATGVKLAARDRPVVACVGDGASLYSIQALWSAVHYRAGVLFVVLSNGGYRVMDRLAAQAGGTPPWPAFGDIDVAGIAEGFGCPAQRIENHPELTAALDLVLPGLADRDRPLVLDVAVTA